MVYTLGFLWAFWSIQSATTQRQVAERPNVLFIAIDDLRPDLAFYGNKEVISPNLNRLADQSTVFTRQFVTQPTCGASRFSLLTGKRPRHPIEIKNEAIEKQIAAQPGEKRPVTFIEALRKQGYYTVGIGKISHSPDGYVYGYNDPKSDVEELPGSWNEILFNPGKWGTGWNAFFGYADGGNRQGKKGNVKPYEAADVADNAYPDGLSAEIAVRKLNELAKKQQPFFLGVGFFKPHLPFTSPQKYWDLYDEKKISLTPSPDLPLNVHEASLHESREFNQYNLGEESASLKGALSPSYARKLKHAYYASVSYTDALIGKVLDALKKNGLDKNTIVVVWSDHGWHLGDYRVWGKHTLFDGSLRSVLLIRRPGAKPGKSDAIVSSVDLYPTLTELCLGQTPPGLDGKSVVPLLNGHKNPGWSNAAYSYYNKGISVRTDRYRLTRYYRDEQPQIELYDHKADPNETRNVAGEHPDIIRQLEPLFRKGDTGLFQNKN